MYMYTITTIRGIYPKYTICIIVQVHINQFHQHILVFWGVKILFCFILAKSICLNLKVYKAICYKIVQEGNHKV